MNRFESTVLPLIFTAILLNTTPRVFAQASPRPHKGAAPAMDFEQYAVYWTAEAGWNTELHLRQPAGPKPHGHSRTSHRRRH